MATAAVTVPAPHQDDALTVCAISLIAAALANVLHEGVGHALIALLTGAQSGVVSTVAWSGAYDSRLVAAGGTLVNLAAALVLWILLRAAKGAPAETRYFLLLGFAFNVFAGTGYFLFSGVTNFGDWQVVIAGTHPYVLWRVLLVIGGAGLYYGAVRMVGAGLVRYVGVALDEPGRFGKLTWIPYFSGVALLAAGGLLNPVGMQLVWESALPAAAGAGSGLVWMRYYIPKRTIPERGSPVVSRSYTWVASAAIVTLAFIFVLGRGITLHR